ncbi:MAG: M1 family metallopeptidase, partial [Candidatus Latescibacteria bacterium]|nr:M1 family metallopeptidase [Candidatus Latescibacterota bacterium]
MNFLSASRASAVSPPGLHYAIDVRLDPLRQRLTGRATIGYRSGADSALPFIYLHAYPNAFRGPHTILGREGERWGEDYALRFASDRERGWMTMDSVFADGLPASLTLDETVARVDLPHPLEPDDSVTLALRFEVQVPKPFNRFGHVGEAYSVGQWYPKVAVYDDLGWHADPYHYFAEFYGDYGTFDVAITLPDRYWVGATGVLEGAEGGDNEIPLADAEMPGDSVTVAIRCVPADSLLGQWPQIKLEIEHDLSPARGGRTQDPLGVTRESGAVVRIPRGAPVHYAYRWRSSKEDSREEADEAGRAGPLRCVIASRDTAIVDTLRALAPQSAPGDSASPSLKTLRFRAERVHDFAWVACPDYVRADTTVLGISIRALAFRDDQRLWSGQKAIVASAIEFMSREVGPYIWPSFTSAEAYSGGGAMEYPMLITNEPDLPSSWLELLDLTIAHELAHNWFYGMLGSDERAFPWLDEGFTEYVEHRYA